MPVETWKSNRIHSYLNEYYQTELSMFNSTLWKLFVLDPKTVHENDSTKLNLRNMLEEATDWTVGSPSGTSRDLLLVARLTHTHVLQGGPQWMSPSPRVFSTSWTSFMKPLLGEHVDVANQIMQLKGKETPWGPNIVFQELFSSLIPFPIPHIAKGSYLKCHSTSDGPRCHRAPWVSGTRGQIWNWGITLPPWRSGKHWCFQRLRSAPSRSLAAWVWPAGGNQTSLARGQRQSLAKDYAF